MTDHAIGSAHAIPDSPAREKAVPEEAPRIEAPAETPPQSSETVAAASLFLIPIVTFLLIVTMWAHVGGF